MSAVGMCSTLFASCVVVSLQGLLRRAWPARKRLGPGPLLPWRLLRREQAQLPQRAE